MHRSAWLAGILIALPIATESLVSAQGIIAERFHSSVTSGGYITAERPETSGPFRIGAGLSTFISGASLRIVAGPFSSPLINHSLSAQVNFTLGIVRFLELGVSVPATLYRDAPGLDSPAAMGDVRVHVKGRLWTSRHFGIGLMGSLLLPTGSGADLAGTGQVAFAPRLLMEGRARWLRAGLNGGVLLRQPGEQSGFSVSHELLYAIAVGMRPHRIVEAIAELYGTTQLEEPFARVSQSPAEVVGALAFQLGPFVLSAGAGGGVVGGYGAPAWRAFVVFRYQQPMREPPPALLTRGPAIAPTPARARLPVPRPLEVPPPETVVEEPTVYRGDAEVKITETELIPSKPIFFAWNQVTITREFRPMLAALARVLRDHPELGVIRIEGHADATGKARYNRYISLKRAREVRRALITLKVPEERLLVIGYGSSRPATSVEDHDQNRRVVFHRAAPERHTAERDREYH